MTLTASSDETPCVALHLEAAAAAAAATLLRLFGDILIFMCDPLLFSFFSVTLISSFPLFRTLDIDRLA